MKILTVGSDRKVFEYGSAVAQRQIRYGRMLERVDIIVFTGRSGSFIKKSLSNNVYIYPTRSFSRFLYIFDALILAVRLQKPDLVSAQDPFESGLAGYLIAKFFGVPLQLQVHTDFLSPYFYSDSFLNKIRFYIAKFVVRRAAGLRVVSSRIKRSLIDAGFVKDESLITVLPIFVDVEKIRNSRVAVNLHKKYPQFKIIVLMASRLTREKNIGLAIEALTKLVPRFPGLGLVIVGDGPLKEKLRSMALKLSIQRNVFFEPWTVDLSSYYKTADIFLITSNFEGYGLTAVESLAAGTPVIMTDVGCAGDLVAHEQNGLVFPVGDLNGLVMAIEKVVSNPSLIGDLKNGAKDTNFPNQDEAEYLDQYRRCWMTSLP